MTDKCCGNCPWSFRENLGGRQSLSVKTQTACISTTVFGCIVTVEAIVGSRGTSRRRERNDNRRLDVDWIYGRLYYCYPCRDCKDCGGMSDYWQWRGLQKGEVDK